MKTKTKKKRISKPGHCSFFLRQVPISVKQGFKVKCARRRISMQEALIDLMIHAWPSS